MGDFSEEHAIEAKKNDSIASATINIDGFEIRSSNSGISNQRNARHNDLILGLVAETRQATVV